MKKYKNIEEIHIKEKKPLPKDFNEVKQELLSDKHREVFTVNMGKNRGQYFIRIPTRMAKILELDDNCKIKITTETKEKESNIKLEIIRGN